MLKKKIVVLTLFSCLCVLCISTQENMPIAVAAEHQSMHASTTYYYKNVVTIVNNTDNGLHLLEEHVDHGQYALPLPQLIKPHRTAVVATGSTTPTVGTEGKVCYAFD